MKQVSGKDFSTRSVQVYRRLRDEIVTGALEPGTRMIRRDLAKRFKMSPIPIIEALHRLERDGLVESVPMYGARVITWDLESLRSDEMLREALECQCARLCALNGTPKDFRELMMVARKLDETTDDPSVDRASSDKMHHRLHIRIAELTGCPSLVRELDKVWLRRQMRFSLKYGRHAPIPADWHEQLITAIATRDPDEAERVMRVHVEHGLSHDAEFVHDLKTSDFEAPEWLDQ